MIDLDGRVGIVTGAAHGIGQGAALALARRGVRVVLADIDAEAAQAGAQAIRDAGGSALALRCDVVAPNALPELREAVEAHWGRPTSS